MVEIFDYGMDADGLARLRTEDELREACRQGSLWHRCYAEHVVSEVSVNLSKKQLLRADLVEKVAEVLSETGMRTSSLFLEAAEDALAEGE